MNTGDIIFASIFVIIGIVNIKIIFDTAAREVASTGKAFALYFFRLWAYMCCTFLSIFSFTSLTGSVIQFSC